MTNFAIFTLFLLLGSATVASARLTLLRVAPVHQADNKHVPHSEFGHLRYREESASALLRELTGYFEDSMSMSMSMPMSMSMSMSMSMPMPMPMSMPMSMSMSMPDMSMSMPNGMPRSVPSRSPSASDGPGLSPSTSPSSVPSGLSPSIGPSTVPNSSPNGNGLGGSIDSPSPLVSPSSAPSSLPALELDGNGDAVIVQGIDADSSTSSSSRSVTPGQTAIIVLVVCAALAVGLLGLRKRSLMMARSSSASGSIFSGLDSASQGSISSFSDGTSHVGDYLA